MTSGGFNEEILKSKNSESFKNFLLHNVFVETFNEVTFQIYVSKYHTFPAF